MCEKDILEGSVKAALFLFEQIIQLEFFRFIGHAHREQKTDFIFTVRVYTPGLRLSHF